MGERPLLPSAGVKRIFLAGNTAGSRCGFPYLNREKDGLFIGIEEIASEYVSENKLVLVQEQSRRNAREELGQRCDRRKHDAADECARNVGGLVQPVDVFCEFYRQEYDNRGKYDIEKIYQNALL